MNYMYIYIHTMCINISLFIISLNNSTPFTLGQYHIYIYIYIFTIDFSHINTTPSSPTSGGLVSVAVPTKLAPCCVYVAAIDQESPDGDPEDDGTHAGVLRDDFWMCGVFGLKFHMDF